MSWPGNTNSASKKPNPTRTPTTPRPRSNNPQPPPTEPTQELAKTRRVHSPLADDVVAAASVSHRRLQHPLDGGLHSSGFGCSVVPGVWRRGPCRLRPANPRRLLFGDDRRTGSAPGGCGGVSGGRRLVGQRTLHGGIVGAARGRGGG